MKTLFNSIQFQKNKIYVFLLLFTSPLPFSLAIGQISPACMSFSIYEQIDGCRNSIQLDANDCLECFHEWSIQSCDPTISLTGNSVKFFLTNYNTYEHPKIEIKHTVTCGKSNTASYIEEYTLINEGIYVGIPEQFDNLQKISLLTHCNSNEQLLTPLIEGKNIYIQSSLQIDRPLQKLKNCQVCMDPGTSVLVGTDNASPNITQRLNAESSSFSNGYSASTGGQSPIWKGIRVANNGYLDLKSSIITGSLVAVEAGKASSQISLRNTSFFNNYIGLVSRVGFINHGISGNFFTGTSNENTLPPNFPAINLNGVLSGQLAGLPYSQIRPFAGICMFGGSLNIFQKNDFDYIGTGIWLENTNSNIQYCDFRNIASTQVLGSGFSGIGIKITNTSTTFRNLDRFNRFGNCKQNSVELNNRALLTYFEGKGLSFLSENNGYNLKLTRGLKKDPLNVLNKSQVISATMFAITRYGVLGTQTGSDINEFFIRESEFYNSAGPLDRSSITLQNLKSTNNSIEISTNFFYTSPFNPSSGHLKNIFLNNVSNARIFNSFIDPIFDVIVYGLKTKSIHIQGGSNNLIDCNRVLGTEDDESVGIWIDNSTSSQVFDNITSYVSDGIRFSGACNTGRKSIKYNTFYHNDYGLVYDADAVTGPQYTGSGTLNVPFESNLNEWKGYDWDAYTGARHKGNQPIVFASQYKSPPPPTIFTGSNFHPYTIQMDQNVASNLWFTEDGSSDFYQETYPCPEHVLIPPIVADADPNSLDKKIINHQTGLDGNVPDGYLWLLEYDVYRKFKEISSETYQDVQITTFLDDRASQPIGQLYDIKDGINNLYRLSPTVENQVNNLAFLIHTRIENISLIDSTLLDSLLSVSSREQLASELSSIKTQYELLQDSFSHILTGINQEFNQNLSALVAQNNAIVCVTEQETNQRFVNNVLLQKIIPQLPVSALEMQYLKQIATQCPMYGGWAVYDAQSYYFWLTDSTINQVDCQIMDERKQHEEKLQNALNNTIVIYPNPATNQLFIQSDNLAKNSTIQVINMLGEILFEKLFYSSTTPIDISTLATGMYMVRLKEKDGESAVKKFVVKN